MEKYINPSTIDYSDFTDIVKINTMEPFPFVPSYHTNLGGFLDSINMRVKDNWDLVRSGELPAEDVPKEVIMVLGWPGHGKSEIARYLKKRFSVFYNHFNPYNLHQYKDVGWEPDGEGRARKLGLITTPPGHPNSDQELIHAQNQFKQRFKRVLDNKTTEVVVCESPGGIAYWNADGEMVGTRPLNAEVMRQILRHEAPFDQHNYRTKVIGVVGGPMLRCALVYFREDINNAKSLEEAQELTYLYGYRKEKDPPLTQLEWDSLKNGATIEQIELIEERTEWMLKTMRKKPGYFPSGDVKEYMRLVHKHDYVVRTLSELGEGKELRYMWELPWFLNFLMSDQDNFNVAPEDRILLYDNPTPADLGISSEQKLEQLVKHLQGRNKTQAA